MTASNQPDLEYERPADHVKTVNVPTVPQRIFDGMITWVSQTDATYAYLLIIGMAKYEDAARGLNITQISGAEDWHI